MMRERVLVRCLYRIAVAPDHCSSTVLHAEPDRDTLSVLICMRCIEITSCIRLLISTLRPRPLTTDLCSIDKSYVAHRIQQLTEIEGPPVH